MVRNQSNRTTKDNRLDTYRQTSNASKSAKKHAAIQVRDKLTMRAPQYGHNKGKRRGLNPFSLPMVRVTSKQVAGRRVTTRRPNRLPAAYVSGAVTIKALNKPIKLGLFHKSAKEMLGSGKKSRPNPVMTKVDAVNEPPRLLCAIPPRDKPKSRNDMRWFQWGGDISKSAASPRHNTLHMRRPKP